MKPIVIYLKNSNDEVKMTKKEFEQYINDAYKHGYDSGYAEGIRRPSWWPYYTSTITNAGNPITTLRTDGTSKESPFTYTTVTCEATNAVGD